MSNIVRDKELFNEVQECVSRVNDYFDLNKFMNGGYNVDVAVCLITPLQVIMTNCYKNNPYMSFYTHEDTMKEIYEAVYSGNNEILAKSWDSIWNYSVIKDGNICMQMCHGIGEDNSNDVVISIPEVISKEQYDALVAFNLYIKKIYENNKDYYDKKPMFFRMICGIEKISDISSSNNIDIMLEEFKTRIGNVSYNDEFIVGCDISSVLNDIKGKGKK